VPTRIAIEKFAKLTRLTVSAAEPTRELLEAIKTRPDRICPLGCGPRQVENNGRCVAKKCLSGFQLDEDGDCVWRWRRRTVTRQEDRSKIQLYESKARHSSEPDAGDKKRVRTSGGRFSCGFKGCQKVPIGCRNVLSPDGRNARASKIV